MSAGRPPLTVIVPTFNEESTLRDCLDSVRFADEILVVDSYSSDATVAIARELGARVLQHEYVYSAKQKNWSIPQATHEWVLLVDSDERVTPELREEILALLAAGPRHDGYWIPRANHFLGRRIRRCGWGTDKVIRLFRRDAARYQDREVHAEIDLPGPLWGAAQLYKEGRRAGALQIFGRPVTRFFKMYVVRLGCLEGLHGLVLSMLGAFTVYLKYARLWEMHVLRGAVGITPQVEADGLQAQEQIGRMVDEERRPRHDRAPGHPGRPGQSAQPR